MADVPDSSHEISDTRDEESKDSQSNEDTSLSQDAPVDASSQQQYTSNTVTNETKSVSEENHDSYNLKILNSDMVEVESYTDSSQGPIVALSLGLAITMLMLIFVGCRLRTVKRRLRKGRALHSNEADYLINGMYL